MPVLEWLGYAGFNCLAILSIFILIDAYRRLSKVLERDSTQINRKLLFLKITFVILGSIGQNLLTISIVIFTSITSGTANKDQSQVIAYSRMLWWATEASIIFDLTTALPILIILKTLIQRMIAE